MRASPGILVAGGTADERASLGELLASAGYRRVWHAPDVTSLPVGGGPYDVVALVAGADAEEHARTVRSIPALARASLLLVLREEGWGTAASADDMVHLPTTREEVETRIDRLTRSTSGRLETVRPGDVPTSASEEHQQAILDILRTIASVLDASRAVREILEIVVEDLHFDRASLIMRPETSEHAFVAGATDDPTLTKYVVSLPDYPELLAAFEGGSPVMIDDLRTHPLLRDKAETLAGRVGSLAVFPLLWRHRTCGTLFLRASQPGHGRLGPRELAFAQIVAGILAQYTEGGHALDEIAEQSRPLALQKFMVEQRHRAIERLADYFESASDGIVVLCGEGRILSMNRAAEGLTGFSREGLLGETLADLVPEPERENLARVVAAVVGGTNLEPFDLGLSTSSGDVIIASVTTSTILTEHKAAILSFRDVTAERALESELRNTKEFLEKLIDSTVDAIAAADLDGRIILFNPGAERLFGWRAEEVLGHLSVEQLYPKDVARQIMRMLRSASYGGVGRLETCRREVTTKDGEIVPVNMTASIVYDEGVREVATVGIFSDLRERIRIEKRLLQAQEKLATTEKQALVSELAGATAHELNQPLTSVIGYAELLRKKLGDDSPLAGKADIIISEAIRMADIVRKIGRITRYETKSYVGSTQILDLEKAASEEEAAAPPRTGPLLPPENR